MHSYVCVYMCVLPKFVTYVYTHIYVSMYVYIYVCNTFTYVDTYTFQHIHITYTQIYIYTYIYIHTHILLIHHKETHEYTAIFYMYRQLWVMYATAEYVHTGVYTHVSRTSRVKRLFTPILKASPGERSGGMFAGSFVLGRNEAGCGASLVSE